MGFNSEAKSGKGQLGWVEVEPVEGEEGGDRRVDQSLYTWRPGPELEFRLPSDFRLDFVCSVGADGARRFEPAKGLNVFLLEASVGGLALLDHVHDLTPEVRFAYHAMRLVFQHARKTHEHLDRSFRRASDLRVMGTDVDVLPDCLGFSALDKSSRWSVAELIRRGRKALMSGGESDVNEERSITAGLLEAARLNPIDLTGWSESEHRILVRLALFDLPREDGAPDPAVKEKVTDRFLRALEDHIDDETEVFNRWYFNRRDELIRQIADQRTEGGPIPRATVRWALLEVIWDSFFYAGDCIALQMQAFARALPEPLRPEERPALEALYARQHYLGGLPMVLLQDRFAFLRGAILDLMEDPADPTRIGVLLRLLEYYAGMVNRRRQADRAAKRPRNIPFQASGEIASSSPGGTSEFDRTGLFDEIIEELCQAESIRCDCGEIEWWSATMVDEDPKADPIRLKLRCLKCKKTQSLVVARDQFERVAHRVWAEKDQ